MQLLWIIVILEMTILVKGITKDLSSTIGWQYGKSLSECNRYMLDNQLGTDISFKVGPPTGVQSLIRAHKYVLISRSAVFETMFYARNTTLLSETPENGATIDDPIVISDMNPGVFKDMLNFIYTDNVTVNFKTLLPLMYAGKKYQLPKLINECQKVLQHNISVSNVCEILDQAIYFDEQELVNKSLQFIGEHAVKVVKTEGFLQMSRPSLLKMVSYDWLQIGEVTLYKACIAWAEVQLQKLLVESPTEHAVREQLAEVFHKIRFPSMTLEEFAQIAGRSDMLTCAEKASIYYYIGTEDHENHTLVFVWKKRYNEKMIDRFQSVVNSDWGCSNQQDSIQFKTDKDITLTGIGTYPTGSNNGYRYGQIIQNAYNITIDITRNSHRHGQDRHHQHINGQQSNHRIGGIPSTAINSTMFNGSNIAKVPLRESLEIKAGVHYTITIRQVNGNGCYSRYGQTNVPDNPMQTEDVTFWFYNAGNSNTSPTNGQIPRLFYIVF